MVLGNSCNWLKVANNLLSLPNAAHISEGREVNLLRTTNSSNHIWVNKVIEWVVDIHEEVEVEEEEEEEEE